MAKIDWHVAPLSREMMLDSEFRISQNVRWFMTAELKQSGPVKLPRAFHDWLKSGTAQTLGDVVDEWQQRYGQ